MNEKSHVGMGYYQCPICLELHGEVVILDMRLEDSLERKNVLGHELCPEHKRLYDKGYIALVGTHNENVTGKTLNGKSAIYAGNYAHIKREKFNLIFTGEIPTETPMVFCPAELIDRLRAEKEKRENEDDENNSQVSDGPV